MSRETEGDYPSQKRDLSRGRSQLMGHSANMPSLAESETDEISQKRDLSRGRAPSYMSKLDDKRDPSSSPAGNRHARAPPEPEVVTVPSPHRKFGSAGPLGLLCTATTLLIDSFIQTGAAGITVPQSVISVALSYGGLAQILAGMWEFASGNTFGATVYTSYGGFWVSYGIFLSPWSGIASAFAKESDFEKSIGLYYFAWMITTLAFLVASHRSSIALIVLFVFLSLCFFFLGVAKWYPEITAINTTGGVFGILTSAVAWYMALAGMLPEDSLISLPVGNLS